MAALLFIGFLIGIVVKALEIYSEPQRLRKKHAQQRRNNEPKYFIRPNKSFNKKVSSDN